jgi:hypothetical protein
MRHVAPQEGQERMTELPSLAALGLDWDPVVTSLSYPGALPTDDGLLFDGCYLRLKPVGGTQARQLAG